MNISTIEIPKEKALELFEQYRASVQQRHTDEDAVIMRGYKALSQGHSIFDLAQVMKQSGLDHQYRPRLAITRADSNVVWFQYSDSTGIFSWKQDAYRRNASNYYLRLPSGTYPEEVQKWNQWHAKLKAITPNVPPAIRPKHSLANYHVLWEPDWQLEPPIDPILCKRLPGTLLFIVLATWDLTELERVVIRSRLT